MELYRRGIARKEHYAVFNWNKESVVTLLQPFQEVAESVTNNLRTDFTNGGGLIRKKDEEQRMWIDSYSAIKTDKVNAAFACRVKAPGCEPIFELKAGDEEKPVSLDEVDDALNEWKIIASEA